MSVVRPSWWLVNIGSGNGLVPSGNKPLPEPMLTQIDVVIQAPMSWDSLLRVWVIQKYALPKKIQLQSQWFSWIKFSEIMLKKSPLMKYDICLFLEMLLQIILNVRSKKIWLYVEKFQSKYHHSHINGLVKDCRTSLADGLEVPQWCIHHGDLISP